jgi:general secretion pathway protein D
MRLLIVGIVLVVGGQMQTYSLAEMFFSQMARTTKRGGLEMVPSAPIGIPQPRQDGTVSDDEFVQTQALQELLARRLKSQANAQAATADTQVVTTPTPDQPPPAPQSPSSGRPAAPARTAAPGISLSFTNAPIDTVVNAIMRELGHSYVIDPSVQGSVSLFTMGDIPTENLFEVLEQILKMNGYSIVRQEGLYVIVPASAGAKVPHRILVKPEPPGSPETQSPQNQQEESPEGAPQQQEDSGTDSAFPPPGRSAPVPQETSAVPVQGPNSARQVDPQLSEERGVITYLIPLHYIPSDQMLQMIQPFVSPGATVIDFAPSNIVLITDYRRNIEQVLNLVDLLDTQYFSINTVDLIPIRHNQAKDVAEDLAKIFAPGDKTGGVRLVAVERLNSILTVTHAPAVLQEVKKWIDRLDAPSTNTNIKTFVYQVENNTAMNIAEVLSQLYSDGLGLPSGATGDAQREAQARQQQQPYREAGFVSPYEQMQRGPRAGLRSELGPSLTGRPMSAQPGIRAVVSGNVKIIVNEYNNSLIIQATEADYSFLLQTITQLDVLPRQVLIEAKIYSVELRDELSFGVSAFLEGRDFEGPATVAQISGPTATSPGGALSLATRTIVGTGRQLEAIISALRAHTNVEVVEAPRLLAVDGMQAQINVGAEVPVTSSAFGDPLRSGDPTAFISNIQFRPTGTTMLIMPRISASGIVTMDLAVEVSAAVGTGLTPTINRNYVETSLIIQDGQTVAIAGIMSDQLSTSRNRVPVLGDIPILGVLFGQTSRNARRSELIFLITPHVIRNLPTAAELTLDFKRALRNAYDVIEQKEAQQMELMRRRREQELRREEPR